MSTRMNLHAGVKALRRIDVLGNLPAASFEHLAESCIWREYAAGEQICGYQDQSTDVLFLLAGKARVIIYSAEGKAVLFVDLAPATMFGEIAAIDGQPRSASVEALEPCSVASLSAKKFQELLLNEPSVTLATLRHLTSEVRRLSERVFEFSTMMVQNRIQAELIRLANEVQQSNEQIMLAPAPSLSDIANRVSTHREAVSREISRLTSLGVLRRERDGLRIIDPNKLKQLLERARGD